VIVPGQVVDLKDGKGEESNYCCQLLDLSPFPYPLSIREQRAGDLAAKQLPRAYHLSVW